MATNKSHWGNLPPEIQLEIARFLPSIGGKCSELATVCRAWQSIIEPLNFGEIGLTLSRLEDPRSQDILFRKRNLIRYIWLRLELEEYDCNTCTGDDDDEDYYWGLSDHDNSFIAYSFELLFTRLSAWEPRGDLVLDISVYSPSDNKHWFKYLTFCSDTDVPECPPGCDLHDPAHGWTDGRQTKAPTNRATERMFEEIMEEESFSGAPSEMEWWTSLPMVPVVGVVLLRQQTRRRWSPTVLANMFTRFPNLKDLFYEPWREWDDDFDIQADQRTETLIASFASTRLCNLTIFENFNETYSEICSTESYPVAAVRVPDPDVSKKLARASLRLTTLSAAFMVDASDFFEARRDSWTWDKLTSLALTSGTLTNDANPGDIKKMLQAAAISALQMPQLDTMEIWNGRRGVAIMFRFERARDQQPSMITIRGTWELDITPAIKRAWDRVARETAGIQRSLIDPDLIRSHGDAIRELRLSAEVVRPVSLQQILIEDQLRAN